MEPALLLCDEPTSALDPETIGEVLITLQNLAASGMTMICVTHEMGFASRVANNIVFMDHGRIIETGTPAELLRNPKSPRLREFLGQLISLDRPMVLGEQNDC